MVKGKRFSESDIPKDTKVENSDISLASQNYLNRRNKYEVVSVEERFKSAASMEGNF